MSNEDRFIDNENGTLTDKKYNLMWAKEDSYLMRGKWCNWMGAQKFIQWLNEQKFAGHDDWRVPTSQECRNLYEHECKNTDYDGGIVHIDLKFPEGCGSTVWSNEDKGINAMAYNFYSDRAYLIRKKTKDESQMTCRPIRTAGPPVKRQGRLSATGRSRRE